MINYGVPDQDSIDFYTYSVGKFKEVFQYYETV